MSVTYQSGTPATPPNTTKIKTTSSGDGEIQHVIVDDLPALTSADVVTVTGGTGQAADVKVTLDSESVTVGSITAGNNIIGQVKLTDGTDLADVVTGTATGIKGLRVYGGPTDPISDVPVVIEFDHHQVHEGESFGYSNLTASLASGSNKDFRIRPSSDADTSPDEAPHFIFEVVTTLEAEAYLYEDMTYTVGNGGTERTPANRSRVSDGAAVTDLFEDTTPATTGTNLWIGLMGSGNRAGAGSRSLTEWILHPGKDYLFRVASKANGNKVLVRFEWYEDLGI